MNHLKSNRELIAERDAQFARELANRMLKRPNLSIWMILIPIILVFYIQQYQRYAKGKRDFARNYLVSLKKALNAAFSAIEENTEVDMESIGQADELAEESLPKYRKLLEVLVEHYTVLLNAKGETFAELVVDGFANADAYRQALAKLNAAWSELNRSIGRQSFQNDAPQLATIKRMERFSEEMREEEATLYFQNIEASPKCKA